MRKVLVNVAIALSLWPFAGSVSWGHSVDELDRVWESPPIQARVRAYWWWLNGNVTKEAITRDLEEMKRQGFGGAVIMDAGGAEQNGNAPVPHGATFMSPQWRALYKHALSEAHRLGLELGLNIQSGWNLGGPLVTPDEAVKKLTWAVTEVTGPRTELRLPEPPSNDGYYRDIAVLAWPVAEGKTNRASLKNYKVKALLDRPSFKGPHAWFLANSAPYTAPFLLEEDEVRPGEEDTTLYRILNLTSYLQIRSNGVFLAWEIPAGRWLVLRMGYTLGDWRHVSTHSEGWGGYALDVLDAAPLLRYWKEVVDPLIEDAGSLAGKTLKYLHTDSWEIEYFNWTVKMPEEFRKRRGYDLTNWLPVVAGFIVNDRVQSTRFLEDFRRTLGDLAADNHYRVFARLAHERGLLIHPESGGPHFTPIDAQQCLGINDIPMSEFWAMAKTHRSIDETRFFVKQPASAAHTMGKRIVAAEGFTTVGPHWQERIWDNLKPSFDQALCEGLNLLVWHAVVCSPPEMGIPGQQYFAGTHFNPNTTWWPKSHAFLNYINRCQALLQQGLFVADVLYYYGDHVPNYAQSKRTDPAGILPGYDYDVISAEGLLSRVGVRDGKLVLPDGMSYEVLVLPPYKQISLQVLRKIKALVEDGATVVGQKPERASGLSGYPECDREVKRIADELWGDGTAPGVSRRRVGRGFVISGIPVRDVLRERGILPDFEVVQASHPEAIDYIHRKTDSAHIYFLANKTNQAQAFIGWFRVQGLHPELWDPVTGEKWLATDFTTNGSRVGLPLELGPYGSMFVVFRKPLAGPPVRNQKNFRTFRKLKEIQAPWLVSFDPAWGGPGRVQFDQLVDWTKHADPGIKFYSGTAKYEKSFTLSEDELKGGRLWLTLGDVREIAEVFMNGTSCGVVWYPPFRVDITSAARPGTNYLCVEVVNFWCNRVIGDQSLPERERYTRTNIRRLTAQTPLLESGLFGPVWIEVSTD